MNAKEAKEILQEPITSAKALERMGHWAARGYLEALEGPEVKALVDALEMAQEYIAFKGGINISNNLNETLAQYREAVKK